MDKQEFICRRKLFESRSKRIGHIYTGVFIGLSLPSFVLYKYLQPWTEPWGSIYWTVFLGLIVAMTLCFKLFDKSQKQKYELSCKSCNHPLLGVQADIAIATSICPDCGEPAFDT